MFQIALAIAKRIGSNFSQMMIRTMEKGSALTIFVASISFFLKSEAKLHVYCAPAEASGTFLNSE